MENEKTYKYKVKFPINWEYADLSNAIAQGAKFVIYPYTFAFGLSVALYSKVHIVQNGESSVSKGIPFMLFSLLFGWLNIPYGPYRVIVCIKDVLKGGIDVTDDIVANISEEEFNHSKTLSVFEVTGTKATQLFKRMDRSDEKACLKVCQKIALEFPEIEEFAFGFYINTGNYNPYRCLALGGTFTTEIDTKRIIELLQTKFYKRVYFKIIDMNQDAELTMAIKKQAKFVIRSEIM